MDGPERIGGPALEGLHSSWALRGSLPGFGQLALVQPLGGLVTEETGDTTAHRTSWDPRLSQETDWGKLWFSEQVSTFQDPL